MTDWSKSALAQLDRGNGVPYPEAAANAAVAQVYATLAVAEAIRDLARETTP